MNREEDDFLEDLMSELRGDKVDNSIESQVEREPSEISTPKRAGLLQMFSEEKEESSGVEPIINDNSNLNKSVIEESPQEKRSTGTGLLGKLFGGGPESSTAEEVSKGVSDDINSAIDSKVVEEESFRWFIF